MDSELLSREEYWRQANRRDDGFSTGTPIWLTRCGIPLGVLEMRKYMDILNDRHHENQDNS